MKQENQPGLWDGSPLRPRARVDGSALCVREQEHVSGVGKAAHEQVGVGGDLCKEEEGGYEVSGHFTNFCYVLCPGQELAVQRTVISLNQQVNRSLNHQFLSWTWTLYMCVHGRSLYRRCTV